MKVSQLIGSRKHVFSIIEDTSVHEAAQYLREKQLRSVGVRGADGKLLGVVSQSDISDKVAAENKCPAWMKRLAPISSKLSFSRSASDRLSTQNPLARRANNLLSPPFSFSRVTLFL